MSSSISAVQGTSHPVHGHHHRPSASASQTGPSVGSAAASSTAGVPASSSTPPGTGLQKFASDLQSILLSAQSDHSSASGTSGSTAATATASADPKGPIRSLAAQLQDLLGSGAASASASAASTPDSLDHVLNTLQQTLQKTLATYGSQAAAPSATLVTA